MKISVIAIFYNSSPWLHRCVDSILSQQGDFELELIAVDDCSQDNTHGLLNAYGDPRMRVIRHERNLGISGARNTGMGHVTGDCFFFIDGDDFLPEGAFATLAASYADDVDWVQGGYSELDAKGREQRRRCSRRAVYTSHQEIVDNYLSLEFTYPHNRLINKRFADIPFPLGKIHEDVYWNALAFPRLNKIVNLEDATYCHINHEGSFFLKIRASERAITDVIDLIDTMEKLPEACWKRRAAEFCLMYLESVLYNACMSKKFRKRIRRQMQERYPLKADVSHLPRYVRLRHWLFAGKAPDVLIRLMTWLRTWQCRLFGIELT